MTFQASLTQVEIRLGSLATKGIKSIVQRNSALREQLLHFIYRGNAIIYFYTEVSQTEVPKVRCPLAN